MPNSESAPKCQKIYVIPLIETQSVFFVDLCYITNSTTHKHIVLSFQWHTIDQGSQTRGPQGRFVWPGMLFRNFKELTLTLFFGP